MFQLSYMDFRISILLVVLLGGAAQLVQHASSAAASSSLESQQEQQGLRWNHPVRGMVDRVNQDGGPYVGIVMAYSTKEMALRSSGLFIPSSRFNSVDLSEEKGEFTEMKIGDYNVPKEGENLLGKVEFRTEELYSVGQPMKDVFWLEVDQTWFNLAAQLQDLELQQCVNETYCLPKTPRVEYGLRGSTADIFVDNAAYRKFLFNKFEVSTVDEESAAVVMTSMSSGVPCIVFRGVSDLAGGGGNDKLSSSMFLSSLAAVNALNVTVKFIELIRKQDLSDHR